MDLKLFQMLEFMNTRLLNIEKNIQRIEDKIDFSVALQRNHLVRVKNNEDLSDDQILLGCPYNDLTPEKSYELFKNEKKDVILLDVSMKGFNPDNRPKNAIIIPLEDLNTRYSEIQNKTTPILVISEEGVRSIVACEALIRKGFFNLNNISGGYKFWPEEVEDAKNGSAEEKAKSA